MARAEDGDGAGGRPRQAHAAALRDDAEAAGRGGRPRADRPLPRRARRGGRRDARSSTSTISPISCEAHLAGRSGAADRHLRRARRAARDRRRHRARRCRCSAASRSCCAIPIPSGSRACGPISTGWPAAGTMRAWMRCCCSPRRCAPSAIPAAAISSSTRMGRLTRRAGAHGRALRLCRRGDPASAPLRRCAGRARSRSTSCSTGRSRPGGSSASASTALWINVETPAAVAAAEQAHRGERRLRRDARAERLHHPARRAVPRHAGRRRCSTAG